MKADNYVVIQGFMRTELGLKGNDLLAYAIIYGFSQAEAQRFTGSLQYLADWCGCTKQGIMKNLKNLQERGLIVKEETKRNGVNSVSYYTTQFHAAVNSVSCGGKLSFTEGGKLSLPNNIEHNNKADNQADNKKFYPPTVEDVQAYCMERGNMVDAQRFVDFYEAKGWLVGKAKMKDWRAAVRTWERPREKSFTEIAGTW
jgi:DNA-binding MarR family transcriptional regulator